MNTESLRNEVLVPAVAKTLDIAAKSKTYKKNFSQQQKSLLLWRSCNSCCILSGTSSIAQPIRN